MTKQNYSRISNHLAKLMNIPEITRQYTPVQGLEPLVEEKPFKGKIETGIPGTERMYGSEMIVFSSTQCAARCVACIRKNYGWENILSPNDLDKLREYVDREGIKEVLLTGGDPLTDPEYTLKIVNNLLKTKVKHIRIGTAMLRADPLAIKDEFIAGLRDCNKTPGFIEVSPHFDHPADFSKETIVQINKLNNSGIRLYVQTILLKGVNDNPETFRELAERIRDNGMEWHHFYHCVPVAGNLHLRTPIEKGFELMDSLENHKEVTGRHPPKRYTLPSSFGKVYLDRSRIKNHEGDYVWIETRYTPDLLRVLPREGYYRIGEKGVLELKYLDGKDDNRK